MMPIYMIIAALALEAFAQGSVECDFTAVSGEQQCFGAVGQLLLFHLPITTHTDIRLIKDKKTIILKIKRDKIITLKPEYMNLSELFSNGSIKLGRAMKKHSGEYVMEEFTSNGVLLKKVKVHLEIKAPVSKPAVSQTCLSQEQMFVSCSSEGDEVQFHLILDGLSLMQAKDQMYGRTASSQSVTLDSDKNEGPAVSNVTIRLPGQLTGNLMCKVWNNVSSEETVIHLSCKDIATFFPVMAVAFSILAVLLVLLIGVLIMFKHKATSTTVVDEDVQDNPEEAIVYSAVTCGSRNDQSSP